MPRNDEKGIEKKWSFSSRIVSLTSVSSIRQQLGDRIYTFSTFYTYLPNGSTCLHTIITFIHGKSSPLIHTLNTHDNSLRRKFYRFALMKLVGFFLSFREKLSSYASLLIFL